MAVKINCINLILLFTFHSGPMSNFRRDTNFSSSVSLAMCEEDGISQLRFERHPSVNKLYLIVSGGWNEGIGINRSFFFSLISNQMKPPTCFAKVY